MIPFVIRVRVFKPENALIKFYLKVNEGRPGRREELEETEVCFYLFSGKRQGLSVTLSPVIQCKDLGLSQPTPPPRNSPGHQLFQASKDTMS